MIIIHYKTNSSSVQNLENYLLEKGATFGEQKMFVTEDKISRMFNTGSPRVKYKNLITYNLPSCKVNVCSDIIKFREEYICPDPFWARIIFTGEREKQEALIFAHVFADEVCKITKYNFKPANPNNF